MGFPVPRRTGLAVLLFYLCAFLLTSGGRLGSLDAGSQLQATLLWIRTGSPSTPTALPPEPILWVKSPAGPFYQCHDIGNLVLMWPAAFLSSVTSKLSNEEITRDPPPIARVGVSLTYAVVAALGGFFLFLAFCYFRPPQTAFFLSAAFAFTTFYWAYSKVAWDVMGSAAGVCFLIYAAARIAALDSRRVADYLALAFGVIWASSFRFSLFPSLGLGGLLFLWFRRKNLGSTALPAFLAALALGLAPTLVYNYVRMGSWMPATTAAQFAATSDLQGSLSSGMYGLLFSPNKGLFWFAPIFLLLLAAPAAWPRLPRWTRELALSLAAAALSYVLLIAKIRNWGTFGWGPRYLVPVLPILFFLMAPALTQLWPRWKAPVAALLLLSFLLNVAPVLVNWGLAIADPVTADPHLAVPKAHQKIWEGLWRGVRGEPPNFSATDVGDPLRSRGANFPDLWTARLMETSPGGTVAALATLAVLLAGLFFSLRMLLDQPAAQGEHRK